MKTTIIIILLMTVSTSFADVCGDVNHDYKMNLLDISRIINYLYKGRIAPDCGTSYEGICGDVNGDGKLNLLDVSYTINYLYRGGQGPFCGTVTDLDGNTYQTIKIGDQIWMAENLKVTHYRNGDAIPNVTDGSVWDGLTTGAYSEYNNNIDNVKIYGRLYNWYSINDSRNLAPEGWHIASDAEWKQLETYLGMDQSQANSTGWRGIDEGGKLKESGTIHWLIPNTGGNNKSGFSALPGGCRTSLNGEFVGMGSGAYYWTSTENSSTNAMGRDVSNIYSEINRLDFIKQDGFSVRCIKGNANTVTDIDGNVYNTVTIGSQVWMAENLKVTHYRNGDYIPYIYCPDGGDWADAQVAYDCNEANANIYGRLYNWGAMADGRKIAPAGWHVPTDAEWQILVDFLGDSTTAGGKMKEAGTAHWFAPNTDATNESGFSALPGGHYHWAGFFELLGYYAIFWSSEEPISGQSPVRALSSNDAGIHRFNLYSIEALSIRCVKDSL